MSERDTDGELGPQLAALASEHRDEFGPAMAWLVAHPEPARPPLRQWIARGDDDMGTRRAFDVLGRIGHPDDVAPLAARLAKGPETISQDAAHGLALHRSPSALAALVAATAAPTTSVAAAAIVALGERKDAAARPTLEQLLGSPSKILRFRAVHALLGLGPAPSRAALEARRAVEKDGEVRGLIDRALGGR